MPINLVAFGVILLSVELTVYTVVFSYRCPNLTSVVCMGTANFALMNSAPTSSSAAELTTTLIICEMLRTPPLFCGTISSSLDMKKYPPLGFLPWSLSGMMHRCGLQGSYPMLGRQVRPLHAWIPNLKTLHIFSLSLPFACSDATALVGINNMLSSTLPGNRNTPVTCMMNILPSFLRGIPLQVLHIGLLLHNWGGMPMRLVLGAVWSHVVETLEGIVNVSWYW